MACLPRQCSLTQLQHHTSTHKSFVYLYRWPQNPGGLYHHVNTIVDLRWESQLPAAHRTNLASLIDHRLDELTRALLPVSCDLLPAISTFCRPHESLSRILASLNYVQADGGA